MPASPHHAEASLSPPKRANTADPGAHELETSESDDHFSDAQSAPSSSGNASPVPKLRVEKVSDEPSYGEVPGTDAYRKREGDAEPDEIAIIPDLGRTSSPLSSPSGGGGWADSAEDVASPPSPGGKPVPVTVLEETEDTSGSVTHPEKRHRSDPSPDRIVKADEHETEHGGSSSADTPISPSLRSPSSPASLRKLSLAHQKSPVSPSFPGPRTPRLEGGGGDDEGFGDDFDDFEEGGEEGGDGDDFGDFDDGFQEPTPESAAPPPAPKLPAAAPPVVHTLSFPIPDFEGLDADEILSATEPYLNAIYPPYEDMPSFPTAPRENPIFQTPRSASLWAQLVAPPPLQPPDWIRSRIRRLFLVSLGVPVDLDEILPASKQKKLILPSLNRVGSSGSLRTSTDSRSNVTKLKQSDANASSTSVDSQGRPGPAGAGGGGGSKRRKGGPAEPSLDLVAAKQLCMTTDAALDGMTDSELREHVAKLGAMEGAAREMLEYWQKRTDEKIGDREAFEGVIENLVKHARKVRK